LLKAEPLVDRKAEPRQWYILHFNLAVNLCHVGRFQEAAQFLQQVRNLVTELGDEINMNRVVWLEGRIAAGLGHLQEARRLLETARREFRLREMFYDVALALLEEAVLLLDERRTVEVQVL